MGRERLRVGEHGEMRLRQNSAGRWSARLQVRDPDGVVRQVSATAASKSAARRAVEGKLARRRPPTETGVTAAMTIHDLGTFWIAHRSAHGRASGRGMLTPQTLASYESALLNIVGPQFGRLPLDEVTVALLDAGFARIESGADGGVSRDGSSGRSTAQARTVLAQMLKLAVRYGALASSPMDLVEPTSRERPGVHHLSMEQVHRLRRLVRRDVLRVPDRRMPNRDLEEWVDLLLGTGCRDGEALGLRWVDLDLRSDPATAHICGTLVEPRGRHVKKLHRQGFTKSRTERTLLLPQPLADVLEARRGRVCPASGDPVFATASGNWVSPPNLRHRLRRAVGEVEDLAAVSPHTLRRTVGTHIAHRAGLDAARDQLGHSDPSVTFQHYVGRRIVGPDLRDVLADFFTP